MEDNITLEITVTENGAPKAGVYVKVTALVRVFSHSRGEGSNVVGEYFNEAQDEEILTNAYGQSIFRYEDASVPEHEGIVIQKVSLSVFNDVWLGWTCSLPAEPSRNADFPCRRRCCGHGSGMGHRQTVSGRKSLAIQWNNGCFQRGRLYRDGVPEYPKGRRRTGEPEFTESTP